MAITKRQKVITTTHTRLIVTTWLYLNANIRERSLSILVAVSVNKDSAQKEKPKLSKTVLI